MTCSVSSVSFITASFARVLLFDVVLRRDRGRPRLAEILQHAAQLVHFQPDGAAAGEMQHDDAVGIGDRKNREELSTVATVDAAEPCGLNLLEPQPGMDAFQGFRALLPLPAEAIQRQDRKSKRLNSSH